MSVSLYKARLEADRRSLTIWRMKQKVVGYCRVSTLEQQKKGYGIDIQVREIERCAHEHGWQVEVFYKDEARSGVDEKRTSLGRLLRECRTGTVGVVIIASLDRLSRSLRFAENLFYGFEQLGVQICIGDMPHYDGNDRKEVLIRQIKAAIAEENRKEIIERLKKGREERVRNGKMSGGTLPYGYARDHGNTQIVPYEAEIVRLIFRFHSQGFKDQEIAIRLNARGYRRRNGTPWTQRQVWAIVHRGALYAEGVIKYGAVVSKNAGLILLQ